MVQRVSRFVAFQGGMLHRIIGVQDLSMCHHIDIQALFVGSKVVLRMLSVYSIPLPVWDP